MLLLLLSCFSRVPLCATPQTAAHQASPSLGFSRQEHWSGLPFLSPMLESEVAQSIWPSATRWTAAFQARPSMGFSRQEYWSGVPSPSPFLDISIPNNLSLLSCCFIIFNMGIMVKFIYLEVCVCVCVCVCLHMPHLRRWRKWKSRLYTVSRVWHDWKFKQSPD